MVHSFPCRIQLHLEVDNRNFSRSGQVNKNWYIASFVLVFITFFGFAPPSFRRLPSSRQAGSVTRCLLEASAGTPSSSRLGYTSAILDKGWSEWSCFDVTVVGACAMATLRAGSLNIVLILYGLHGLLAIEAAAGVANAAAVPLAGCFARFIPRFAQQLSKATDNCSS